MCKSTIRVTLYNGRHIGISSEIVRICYSASVGLLWNQYGGGHSAAEGFFLFSVLIFVDFEC